MVKSIASFVFERLKISSKLRATELSEKQEVTFRNIVNTLLLDKKEIYKGVSDEVIDELKLSIKYWLLDNKIDEIKAYCTVDDYYLLDDIGLNTIHNKLVYDDDDLALKLGREKYYTEVNCRTGCKPSLRVNRIACEFAIDAGAIYFINKEAI